MGVAPSEPIGAQLQIRIPSEFSLCSTVVAESANLMTPALSAVHLERKRSGERQPLGKGKAKIIFAFLSPICYFRLRRFQQVLHVLPFGPRYLLSGAC